MGDPSGIGPEVAVKALASPEVRALANFLLIGDASIAERVRRRMGLKPDCRMVDLPNAGSGIEYVDKALEIIFSGKAKALVTAPLSKTAVRASGIAGFEGHTEYLAAASKTRNYGMIFVGKSLKVSLVTRHIALKDVPGFITEESVFRTIRLTKDSLAGDFRIKNARIAVCGLNPHAGEGGAFGDEEALSIIPAIRRAHKRFRGISGPHPADAVFHQAMEGRFDAVVSMYHDQALAAFKTVYFNTGVNMTMGLPFVRTSPDHGTAFDIAGTGRADPSSMIEAIKLACLISRC